MKKIITLVFSTALFASSLAILSPAPALASPALTTCTDLATHTHVVLALGQSNCRSYQAAALWHLQLVDTSAHSGPGFATLRICSDLHSPSHLYLQIRSSCAKYQKSTLYWRAIDSPATPNITTTVSRNYDSALLTITPDRAGTDSPIAYYLIKNLTTGLTTKIFRTSLATLTEIHITNLQPLTRYTFSITAVSIDGTSATSTASALITTGAIPIPLAAPAFSLSSSAGSTVAGSSVNGYTITSSGGAIDTYSLSPAASTTPGLSFNASTGLVSGTLTTVAGALVYTITATNATGTSSQTFTLTVSAALAAPVFTLSSSSETAGTGSAITGYGISSTGGAIASYAISPAISTTPGLTFSTSSGLISGSPTTVAAAQAYTITATNASGSALQTFTLTVIYGIGSTGPGGGSVFYYNAVGFNCGPTDSATGSPTGGLCHYLEAALKTWDGASIDPNKLWAVAAKQATLVSGITDDLTANNSTAAIGMGYLNSLAIVAQGNSTTTAAGAARAYTGGSKNDWYLPTSAELNQLCKWAKGLAWTSDATVCSGGSFTNGGLSNDSYWASSEYSASFSWFQAFSSGFQGRTNAKGQNRPVRPIRAF